MLLKTQMLTGFLWHLVGKNNHIKINNKFSSSKTTVFSVKNRS